MKVSFSKFSNIKMAISIVTILILAICLIFFLANKNSKRNIISGKTTEIEYKVPKAESTRDYSGWKIYDNKKYNYSLKYPDNWELFDDQAEDDFSDVNMDNNQITKQGGAVFWSNKDNINYTKENKPEDFHLLGLMIYEKLDTDLNQYAKLLGFTDETGTESIPFEADNIVGKGFFSVGAEDKNPRSAIIFKKENRFFVFHLGFIGDDAQALKTMEEIIGSFHIGE